MSDVKAEIVRHHQVIERWLSGTAEPAEFEVLASAHSPDFTWIDTGGAVHTAEETLALFRRAHGVAPCLTIDIVQVTEVAVAPGMWIATFLERQPDGDRQVTVVFTGDERGLHWRHLHETTVSMPFSS